MPVHLDTISAMSSASTSSLRYSRLGLDLLQPRLVRPPAAAPARGSGRSGAPPRAGGRPAGWPARPRSAALSMLGLDLLDLAGWRSFSACHCAFIAWRSARGARRSRARRASRRSTARLVLLLEQRLPLDLELHDAPLHLVDLLGQAVDLDAEPARRLVHQVDRLVGQEAVADVAVGQRGRGHQRVVGDADAVVDLVPLLEAAEDGDGVRDAGLAHQHRLEPALERGVLLDVLAVLVQRGGADDAQLAARERRLEHVARVHRAFGRARADDRVQLVDEGDVLALRSRSAPSPRP